MCTLNCRCIDPLHIHISVDMCPHCGAYIIAGIGRCAGCGKDLDVQVNSAAATEDVRAVAGAI